ncbi:UNVERIFIED_CONTAM: GntR family transcriptional regulator [Spiribacter pallidus]
MSANVGFASMESLSDRVCAAVRKRILNGVYGGGEFLGEEAIASELGVSRPVVSDCLQWLADEGWLELIPYRGARVIDWTPDDSHEVFELRALLEGHAARRAAERIDPSTIGNLQRLIGQEYQAISADRVDHERLSRINLAIHETICSASGSRRLRRLMEGLLDGAVSARNTFGLSQAWLDKAHREHAEIVTALASGDGGKAASVLRTHILSVSNGQPWPTDGDTEEAITSPRSSEC